MNSQAIKEGTTYLWTSKYFALADLWHLLMLSRNTVWVVVNLHSTLRKLYVEEIRIEDIEADRNNNRSGGTTTLPGQTKMKRLCEPLPVPVN